MITALIAVCSIFYLAVVLWVIFVGLVAGGIPFIGIEIKNTSKLIALVLLLGMLWPALLFIPVVNFILNLFKNLFK